MSCPARRTVIELAAGIGFEVVNCGYNSRAVTVAAAGRTRQFPVPPHAPAPRDRRYRCWLHSTHGSLRRLYQQMQAGAL